MKIGIIGGSGKAGRALFSEAVKRGDVPTAIVRDLLGVPHPPGPRHRGGVGDVRVTHVRRERDEAADAMAARVARGFGER